MIISVLMLSEKIYISPRLGCGGFGFLLSSYPQLNVKRTFFILFHACTFYSIFGVTNIFMDFKSRYFLFRFRYSARCRVGENRDLVRGGRSQNVQQTFASYSCLQSFQYKLFIFSSKLCVNTK